VADFITEVLNAEGARRRSSASAAGTRALPPFPRLRGMSGRRGAPHVLPVLRHIETKVTDSRLAGEGRQIRRRRECLSCGERFTTFETAELVMPVVVKGDRSRQTFDESKLRAGMEKALEKRPVPREQIDEALSRITHKVRSLGDREVQSRAIGELVMEELRQLDEVAYVRFASVYRHSRTSRRFTKRSSACATSRRHRRQAASTNASRSASMAASRIGTNCRCCRRSRPLRPRVRFRRRVSKQRRDDFVAQRLVCSPTLIVLR